MKKAIIHYFTGTGNTARVAGLVAQRLEDAGYQVEVKRVEAQTEVVEVSYDLQIFAFPVYAMAPPAIMNRYIKRLPRGKGVKTAIISVYGEVNAQKTVPGWEGQALEQARRMLRRRGYEVFLTDGVGFPESFTQVANPPTLEDQTAIWQMGEAQVAEMVAKILRGEENYKRCGILHQIWTKFLYILYTAIGRRALGKFYIADGSCNGCGLCARACPVGTIKMFRKRPHWKFNCEGCQRCINLCPNVAIQVSYVQLALILLLMFLPYCKWIPGLSALNASLPAVKWVFSTVGWFGGYLLAIYLMDKVLIVLEMVPALRKLFEQGYTRRYRRYLEPNFKAVQK